MERASLVTTSNTKSDEVTPLAKDTFFGERASNARYVYFARNSRAPHVLRLVTPLDSLSHNVVPLAGQIARDKHRRRRVLTAARELAHEWARPMRIPRATAPHLGASVACCGVCLSGSE